MDDITIYLIMSLGGFLLIAVALIHHHNCTEQIQRKKGEIESVKQKLQPRIDILEQEVLDIKVKIDDLDVDIATYQ